MENSCDWGNANGDAKGIIEAIKERKGTRRSYQGGHMRYERL